jgi:hypothetical protein
MNYRIILTIFVAAALAGCGSDSIEDRIYGFWAIDLPACIGETGFDIQPGSVRYLEGGNVRISEQNTVYEEMMRTDDVVVFRFNTAGGQQVMGFNYLPEHPNQLVSLDYDRTLVRCQ